MTSKKTLPLSTGVEIPIIGFGTWGLEEGKEYDSIMCALKCGYRHIDTAKIYEAEEFVGKAVKDSGISREDIFITTKLWNGDQGYDTALKAIDESLGKLGMEYVDLYLIHWPTTDEMKGDNKRKETWKAMEEIYRSGKARAIGVSNYLIEHLEEMKGYAEIPPAVNQIECHPLWSRDDLVRYCQEKNIIVTQYSPVTRKVALDDPVIDAIAVKHGKSAAQVMLRWGIQRDNVVIPKSSDPEHIKENIDIFDFTLDDEDMNKLNSLDRGESVLDVN